MDILYESQGIGEHSFLAMNHHRVGTLYADEDSELVYLWRDDFIRLAPPLTDNKDKTRKKLEFLNSVPLFASLRQKQLKVITMQIAEKKYQFKETVYRQGEMTHSVFVVTKGEF